MPKRLSAILGSVALLLASLYSGRADSTVEYSVQASVTVHASPARITLHWLPDTDALPASYTLYRRAPGQNSWSTLTTLPGNETSWSDSQVDVGVPYEYQIIRQSAAHAGYGYLYAGINVPLTENRGKLLLVVDHTYAAELTAELARLKQDLVGDGWTVVRHDVQRSDPVVRVKKWIQAQYNAEPGRVKAVFLFGHVPVPYSGDIVPDGHYHDHEGAWPSDGYYGDMEGRWTDETVNITSAIDPRNRNVPGDGKFDQSTFPAPLKLMVGRVDLSNMPGRLKLGGPATFPSELALLRNYLNKDHNFRTKVLTAPERGLVGDYFGTRDGEAFAASGWRNFAPFFGAANVTTLPHRGTWISTLHTNAYLWAYGCGSGSFTSIEGIGSVGQYDDGVTTELVDGNVKAIFTMLYGSWLGDWDSEDNLQRAVLATADYGLTCAWSGRPHWFLQHMALGQPIGFSTRITQNDGFTGLYRNERNNCAGWVHVALMGDPTLRMHVVAPPTNLNATDNGGQVQLTWLPAHDSVTGYNIYRSTSPEGPFTRVNPAPVTGTVFTDAAGGARGYTYMVRAVKLETSGSGTYFNLSEGDIAPAGNAAQLATGTTNPPPATVKLRTRTAAHPAAGAPKLSATGAASGTGATDTIWFDDAIPAGAVPGSDGGDSWNWVSSNPTPFSGSAAHQSNLAAGLHEHYFDWTYSQQLNVATGEVLIAYVYLDSANVPTELMLHWNDGSWEHRAYWGTNVMNFGTDGTVSRHYMGPVPVAGQWVRLEVPASAVNLEGSSLKGMTFSLYDGRATWDYVGKSSASTSVVGTNPPPVDSTNPPSTTVTNPSAASLPVTNGLLPGTTIVDDIALKMPHVGDNALHVLSPTLLELKLINTKDPDPAQVSVWNWVNNFQFSGLPASAFAVTANGQSVAVQSVGFKRRPLYAPLVGYDLRIDNSLYLQLSAPISDNQAIEVRNPDGTLWSSNLKFAATVDPLRYSPAIHVNQEGYMPNYSKKAMVGYYLGSLGEMNVPASSGFKIVDAGGATVFQGSLIQRPDVGYLYTPTPYQKVYEADFTGFNTPGQYRLVVPGLGASLPFLINEGIAMDFTRAYALGLYHQRCGTNNTLPYTRHTHDACHIAPASVPVSATDYPFAWTTISNYAMISNPDNPVQTAPKLTSPAAQLFPFIRQGPIDVSGGHHDAGDYSKYTINSAGLIHYLMFAVDSLPGVADLDNLGIPESGDGISDVLQEAKWEADYLAKLQDTDGGFYFLVYPKNREYESNVTPDHGDPQIVYPKTTSVTAAAVAALAQCGASPLMKQKYPAAAAAYMQKAWLGWQFLTNAIAKYGKNGAYQKITHYGDNFADQDELAWAASEMFVATGNPTIQQTLFAWFPDPTDSATFRWGWWRLYGSYGNAVRSYAFAVRSGRLQASQIDATYLAKCQQVITNAGDDVMTWSQEGAYGSSFPEATKHVQGAGWYFSSDQAYDITVAYQLNPRPEYLTAIIANMNYEGGCNPVNASYVTGLGWKQQRDIVSQYASNDRRVMPPSGIPIGNIQSGFQYLGSYQGELRELCFPQDTQGSFPYYDRWGDSWNVEDEFVVLNSARSLGSLAFLAARTSLKTQPWKSVQGQITVPSGTAIVGAPVTLTLQAPGLDLSGARITWEARDAEPAMGASFTYAPKDNGPQWVEAEALLPDGRRIFATNTFNADSTNTVWVDDAVPTGGVTSSLGGDSWNWVTSPVVSGSLAHQSALASGLHQHDFNWATSALTVETGTVLYAYVYLDPANPPTEVMLQWNDGTWEHRAYWGANSITWGTDGTPGRRYMGPLPATGTWVQLQVPASQVALDGSVLQGMGFSTYNGRVTWDAAGVLNTSIGTNSTTSTTVSVAGQDASRVGLSPGGFTFQRSGDTSTALTVSYSLGGTATPGVDYLAPSTSVTIPVGATSATLPITPLTMTNAVADTTVTLDVMPAANYSVASPANATINIIGNTVPGPSLQVGSNGSTIAWPSTSGATYQVAFKNNLADPNWTVLSSSVPAAGNLTSWTDVGARTQSQRFYLVIRIQ